MPEYEEKKVAALALLACMHKKARKDSADAMQRAGAILDKFIFFDDVDLIQIDLNAYTEYSRSQDYGKAGAREAIRKILEASGVEITKTKRGKFVATMKRKNE